MNSKPILFSAPMVRALLAGTKTQTRRALKHQPAPGLTPGHNWVNLATRESGVKFCRHDNSIEVCTTSERIRCPYGAPGDTLWVKETWRPQRDNQCERIAYAADGVVVFEAEIPKGWVRPKAAATGNVSPLFMPRWASRIMLEVTAVRVERLHAISEADAVAEGIEVHTLPEEWHASRPMAGGHVEAICFPKEPSPALIAEMQLSDVRHVPARQLGDPRLAYANLWESINGPGSWSLNPWVWVVEFKRVTP